MPQLDTRALLDCHNRYAMSSAGGQLWSYGSYVLCLAASAILLVNIVKWAPNLSSEG